jgi:endonuclease/exonuclease/phosphatase family metal-dependent hydrolase
LSSPRNAIRIASFNVQGLGEGRKTGPGPVDLITRLLSQFDVIALQEIRSRQDEVLPELVSRLNSSGRKFDFMIGPRVGRTEQREQLAFVFDTERVETDRFQLYTVEDPEDLLHREPLVGWFRTVGLPAQEAFTFSLVNVHIDPDMVEAELQALPNLIQAIAADGRGEDDIILAGDFSASAPRLAMLSMGGMRVLLDGIATTTRGTHQLDNIAFPLVNTTEFTGRSGAYDFLRQFNMNLEQAIQVSEHLPIWAEFSIIEGGRPAQVGPAQLGPTQFGPAQVGIAQAASWATRPYSPNASSEQLMRNSSQ